MLSYVRATRSNVLILNEIRNHQNTIFPYREGKYYLENSDKRYFGIIFIKPSHRRLGNDAQRMNSNSKDV